MSLSSFEESERTSSLQGDVVATSPLSFRR